MQVSLLEKQWFFSFKETILGQAFATRQLVAQFVGSGKSQGAGLERNILRLTLMQYRLTLLNQITQGLHLSTTQLQADLQKGQSLSQIAKAQSISESQLHTIALNAAQAALSQAQQAGVITQWQDTTFTQFLKNHPAVVEHWLHHNFAQKQK